MISYKNLILVQRDNVGMEKVLNKKGMWFNDEEKPFQYKSNEDKVVMVFPTSMSAGLEHVETLPTAEPIGHIVLLCNGTNVMIRNINLPDGGTRKDHLKTFRECLVATILKVVDRSKINECKFTLHLSKVVLGDIVLKETLRQLCMYTGGSNTYVFKTENLYPIYLEPRKLFPESSTNPFASTSNPFMSYRPKHLFEA